MKELLHTIQVIRTALQEGRITPAVEKAAQYYAQECSVVEHRLEQVEGVLKKGSDYQALQMAEQEPPLLEMVAALTFGAEKGWREFCETHGLPVAQSIDGGTMHSLEQLYAKGITANHPLYKDFRAAVLARDDAKSLKIISTIHKLNPGDENARSELKRLQNKHFQETLEKLRAELKTDHEETISRLTEELTDLGTADKLQREDAYVQGQSIRRSWRARQASERLPVLIREMQACHDQDDWRTVGVLLDEVSGIMNEHSIEPADDELKLKLESLTRYFQTKSADNERRQNFEKTLQSFLFFVDEVETRLLSGGGMSPVELSERDESFVRQWKELESHRLAVPNDSLQKITRVGQELRARLEGAQRSRRVRILTAAAAALLAMLSLAAVALHAWKAHSLAAELAAYQDKGSSLTAEALIHQLREEESLLLHWPYLQSRVEEVDAWAKQSRGLEQQAKASLDEIENSFESEVSQVSPPQLVRQLADIAELIKQLPTDLAMEPANRLTALRTRVDLHLETVARDNAARVSTSLADLETLSARELTFDQSINAISTSLTQMDADLKSLEGSLNPGVEALRLPAELETRLLGVRQRVDSFKAELDKFEKARAATADAGTLQAYTRALADWQDIRFAEAAPVSVMLDAMPDEQTFLASLLTGGDKSALKAVLDDLSTIHMAPLEPLERDLRILLEMRDDEFLNNIWENTITESSGRKSQKTYWSKGPLVEAVIGDAKRWSGLSYDASDSASSIIFVEREFRQVAFGGGNTGGQNVVSSQLSGTSQLLNKLQLDRMTDSDGQRFLRPLLELFGLIVNDGDSSPIAKAYLMLRLEDMASPRPMVWGFHYSPSLQSDLAELRSIIGEGGLRSEDWLLNSARTNFAKPLAAFFAKTTGRAYLKEAKARRDLLQTIARAGLKYGGYVETDLSVRLKNPARSVRELWVLSKADGKPMRVANPESGEKLTAAGAMPLSPVFFISADHAALMERYEAALSGSAARAPAGGEALFLKPQDQ